MKKILLLITCLGNLYANAQVNNRHADREYAKDPLWINMMADTTTNFFEIEKAYRLYWQHHEMPEGEHDVIGEHKEREKIPSRRRQKKIREEDRLRVSVKKYERWRQKMLPFVQEDGTILTPSQRLNIWKGIRSDSAR